MQVTAESPIIDVKQNSAVATFNNEVIERIPKGRDFTDLIRAAPGTQVEQKSGIQIDGAGGAEHRYVIDGMDTTGVRTGVSGQELPTDFVQEVQVKSSGYNAEFRATTGGVISAITKSGSNQWHGSTGVYFTNDNFQGTQRPTVRLNPADQTKAETFTVPDDDFSRTEPTFDIGGPILSNRAWFYLGYAPDFDYSNRTVTFRVEQPDVDVLAERDRPQPAGQRDEPVVAEHAAAVLDEPAAAARQARSDFDWHQCQLPGDRTGRHEHLESVALSEHDLHRYVRQLLRRRARLDRDAQAVRQRCGRCVRLRQQRRRRRHAAAPRLRRLELPVPEIPATLQNVNAYADFPSSSVTVYDDFLRNTLRAT